jgi:hypothetical protein
MTLESRSIDTSLTLALSPLRGERVYLRKAAANELSLPAGEGGEGRSQ